MARGKKKAKKVIEPSPEDVGDGVEEQADAPVSEKKLVDIEPEAQKGTSVDTLVARVNKALKGKAIVRKASDRTYQYNIRRPFGILSLDLAVGGGLPAGSICQIYGPEGVGKNYLMNCLIRECQKHYGAAAAIAYTSFEYGYDKAFGWHCGVRVALSQPELDDYIQDLGRKPTPDELKEVQEQIGEFFIIDVGEQGSDVPAEAKLEAVLELLSSGVFQLILIDGLGAFSGKGARLKEEGERRHLDENKKVAANAGLMTDFLSEAFTQLSMPTEDGGMNQTTMVLNNQQRANITTGMNPFLARMAPKTRVGGGYALGHAKAIDIHLRSTKKINVSGRAAGKIVAWNIQKGKLGTHEGIEGEFEYLFSDGANWRADVIATAKTMKLITSRGKLIYVPDKENGISKEDLEAYYDEGPEQEGRISTLIETCMKQAGLRVRYR